jgi:hypothetical protein
MKHFLVAAAALGFIFAAPALAQAPPQAPGPYVDQDCGGWVNDVWVPNGNCQTYVSIIRHASIAGTITAVSGHLVTLQQTNHSVVINDSPALARQQTGKVAVGRQVVAYGYWQDGTFYATAIY